MDFGTRLKGLVQSSNRMTAMAELDRKQKGFFGLDDASKQDFINAQIKAGIATRNSPDTYFDALYRNGQFIDTYGMDKFKLYDSATRNQLLNHKYLLDAYDKIYSPYKYDENNNIVLDDNKNPVLDPLKNTLDAFSYNTYRSMSSEGLKELLEGDYKTLSELNEEAGERKEEGIGNWFNELAPFMLGPATGIQINIADKLLSDEHKNLSPKKFVQSMLADPVFEGIDSYKSISNAAKAEEIYSRDVEREVAAMGNDIDAAKQELNNLSDEEIKKRFYDLITPSEENIGDPALYANLKEGDRSVQDFGIADMREYLAKHSAISKYKGEFAATSAMNNISKKYLAEHEDNTTSKHVGEFVNTVVNYGTAMARGVDNLIAAFDRNKYTVYMNNKGEIVDNKDVEQWDDGSFHVSWSTSKDDTVHPVEMTKQELLQLGKDTDGSEKVWVLNNRIATDSQRFNIMPMNVDRINEARRMGASSSQINYMPGEDAGIAWQTAKMAAFPIMDMVTMIIPTGIGAAGKALGATSKLGRAVGTVAKVGRVAAGLGSAIGIGQDYGTGVFAEAYQGNMQALEEQIYKVGENQYFDSYKNDSKYKTQIDNRVATEARKLKEENNEMSDEDATNYARVKVQNEEAKKFAQIYKDTNPQYVRDMEEAAASATDAANTVFYTEAAKYAAVNMFGYRRNLFKSPEELAKTHLGKFYNSIIEKGGRATLDTTFKKLPTIGITALKQFKGGAWTNFTDEMQSEGGRALNEDRFAAYLNNAYDGEGAIQAYNAFDSFFSGTKRALGKGHTWEAGLVGGLGSMLNFTPNIGGFLEHFGTAEGRAKWSTMTRGEKINALFMNGILNNYYAQKQAYANAQDVVDKVNLFLDNHHDFQALVDALAVNTAEIDASNENDAKIMQYLNGVNAMMLLDRMSKGKSENGSLFDGIALKMTSVKNALDEINKIANSEFTKEEAQKYLQTYYDTNKSLEKTPENDQKAISDIVSNAQRLRDIDTKIREANKVIDSHEKVLGTDYHPTVRGKIIQLMATADFAKDKQKVDEGVITGSSSKTAVSEGRSIQSYGSASARSTMLKSLEEKLTREQSKINEGEEIVKKRKEALDKYIKEKGINTTNDLLSLSKAEQDEYKRLHDDLIDAKLNLGYYQQYHNKISETVDFLKENDGQTPRILKANEIINLSPEDRARMLDPHNSINYSKNQQVEIDKAREELVKRNPNALELVNSQAKLSQHIRSTERMYATMLQNPEAALRQVNAMHNASVATTTATFVDRYIASLEGIVNTLNTLPDVGDRAIRENLAKELRTMNPLMLEAILNKDPNEIPMLSRYRDVVQETLEVVNTLDNIQGAIDSLKADKEYKSFDEKQAKLFSDNIDYLINKQGARTRAEILDTLLYFADESRSPKISSADREKFQRLLEAFRNIEDLDAATRLINKEGKSANTALLTSRGVSSVSVRDQAEQERLTREAEQRAIEAEENKRQAAVQAENIKARAIQQAKDKATSYAQSYGNKNQYRTRVSRLNDGTIITKFERYKETSHGGVRKTDKGIPIDTQTIENNDGIESAELLTLRDNSGEYTGIVRIKTPSGWERKNVKFNNNPISTPRAKQKTTSQTQNNNAQPTNQGTAQVSDSQAEAQQASVQQSTQGTQQQAEAQAEGATQAEASEETTAAQATQEEKTQEEQQPSETPQENQTEEATPVQEETVPTPGPSEAETQEAAEAAEIIETMESPTLEEQLDTLSSEDRTKAEIVPVETRPKTAAELNSTPAETVGENSYQQGNKFPGYDINAANRGVQIPAKGRDAGDSMNEILAWLNNAGIKHQEIIDNELGRILQLNPNTKVYYLRVNPQANATNDVAMQKSALMCIEYTDAVDKIHDKSRGGVITVGNKQYLVFGVFGHVDGNTVLAAEYKRFMDKLKPRAWGFFKNNPSERFWVDPNSYTIIRHISNGVVIKQTIYDSSVRPRTIQELIDLNQEHAEHRNPHGYTLGELSWGIQQRTERLLINVPDASKVDSLRDKDSNVGAVFLLAPTANGRFMPLFIKPTLLDEIKPGALKDEIDSLIMNLASTDYYTRCDALSALTQRIVITNDEDIVANSMQIYIGTPDRSNITIKRNGVSIAHFELTDKSFSVQNLLDIIYRNRPRINVTAGVLSNETLIKMYDDAGALTTDAAKLGTSNAKVSVYITDDNGKPIITTPLESSNTSPQTNSDLDISQRKLTKSEMWHGVTYRKSEDGKWYNGDKEVTNPALIMQIEYNNMIRSNGWAPSYQGVDAKGNLIEYFVISNDRNNPKVLGRVTSTKQAWMLPTNDAITLIDIVAQKEAEAARQQAAKQANKEAAQQATPATTESKSQKPKEQGQEEQLTEEQLVQQGMGNFDTDGRGNVASPQSTNTPITEDQIVIRGSLGKVRPNMGAGDEMHFGTNTEMMRRSVDPGPIAREQGLSTKEPTFIGNTLFIPEKTDSTAKSDLFKGSDRSDWETITFPRELTKTEQEAVLYIVNNYRGVSWNELVEAIVGNIQKANLAEQQANEAKETKESTPIQETPVKSAAQAAQSPIGTTAEEILRGDNAVDLLEILLNKGLDINAPITELVEALKGKVETEGITDINAWLDKVRNCTIF